LREIQRFQYFDADGPRHFWGINISEFNALALPCY